MIGYALTDKASNQTLVTYTSVPNRISLPSKPDGALVMGDDLLGWEDDNYKLVEVTLPDPPVPIPQIISDRQFFQQLAVQGVITQDEALAAVGPGTLPASLVMLVAALPADQQFPANMLLKGAVQFDRQHPMVAILGAAFGWSGRQIDDLWRAASLL